jgi:hypothetical protein
MSDLTPCNYCTLQSMKAKAKERGTTVIVIHEALGEMRGWYSARYSDKKEPSAWFMVLTAGCAC